MYPIWEVPHLTAGMVIGLIATFHILPSHLSTGAMWLNVWFERKAYQENRPELLDFVKRYSKLLLIFAYVFGSLSGVGIWFATTVAAPRAISGLIHNYVWGWAAEWCFFMIEVAGIYVYVYTFDKVDRKTHLNIGWVFAFASWTTMIIIVGILTFMLTPGVWPQTGKFFDGFFNQTYWPQLLMRTSAMFAIAGAWAVLVASRLKDERARASVVRTASLWGLGGLALAGVFLLWYRAVLPPPAQADLAALLRPGLKTGLIVPPALTALYFAFLGARPRAASFWPGLLAIVMIFAGIFSFERTRELIRKPYVIPGYMFSNQIIGNDLPAKGISSELPKINAEGILKFDPFVPPELREVTDANRLRAGRMIALIECSSCHSLETGGIRPLPVFIKRLGAASPDDVSTVIDSLGAMPFMPGFSGTDAEKKALAAYLASIAK
ncbi:MAG: cytochrome ubiquinol oxidase subunit I [Elusimicrobia bacterium]|nr:cytochrome ubiquinol oxidase subunit I [Elusimicrobiota bacterium]